MRYFAFADAHGNYHAMLTGLIKAGYDQENPEHQLISLGDDFGRAQTFDHDGSLGIYEYLTSESHANKPIVLFGNHADILIKMVERKDFTATDFYNGEVKTISSLSGFSEFSLFEMGKEELAEKVFSHPKVLEVYEWLKTLPFYYDEDGFRFFHGWQPDNGGRLVANPANVSRKRWLGAAWAHTENKIWRFDSVYPKGWKKTLVVGHWFSYLLRNLWPDGNPDEYGIWYDKTHKLIALDACTPRSKQVNVLVIEDRKILNEELQSCGYEEENNE